MAARSHSGHSRPAGSDSSAIRARVHLNALNALPEVLEGFGENSDLVLRCAGLTREHLSDPHRSASFADLDRLLDTCVRRTGCPHLGLLLGCHVRLESLGLVGRLARHSETVGAALADLSRYFALHDSGGTLQVTVEGGQALLSYGIRVSDLLRAEQIHDLCAAASCGVLRQLCGDAFRPREVLLPRYRPRNPRPYEEFFRAPVRFDAMQCGVVFPTDILSWPVASADALLHAVLEEHMASALVGADPLLHSDVRQAIADRLSAGDCTRAAVAQRLGLHERAFGRRLQAAGTTFQSLRDEMRLQLARQLLHDTDATVARIAASLGYADSTVFSRSLRRWTGMTPREFRARTDRPH